jgi:hypothetical protein
MMRVKALTRTLVLLGGVGFALSACVVEPYPGYAYSAPPAAPYAYGPANNYAPGYGYDGYGYGYAPSYGVPVFGFYGDGGGRHRR